MLNVEPLPLAVDPPVAVHENEYGAVPPAAEAVQATAVPTVPVDGQVIVATSGSGLIATVPEADALFDAESETVALIVNVPLVG